MAVISILIYCPMDMQQQLQEDLQLSSQGEEEESNGVGVQKAKKVFMPADYNKAKRMVTKLVNGYFDAIKEEVKAGAKLFLDRSKIGDIEDAIVGYVGLRYNDKPPKLQLRLKNQDTKNRGGKNYGLTYYMPESEKIVSYGSSTGKMSVTVLNRGDYKLPDIGTPIAFENSVFILDPCNYDLVRKMFVPSSPAFSIALDGRLTQIAPPIYLRSKSAVIKKDHFVFLVGGEATQRKIPTNHCQKYNLRTLSSVQLPSMNHKHICPSGCFLNDQLWIFSRCYLQMFNGQGWIDVILPFGSRFLPFQFVMPLNQQEILIFGGANWNQKSREVQIFNTKHNNINRYGRLLPQGMSNQRTGGASVIQGCIAAVSCVQASVYPQVGVKSNMCEVVYLFDSSAFLNSVLVL